MSYGYGNGYGSGYGSGYGYGNSGYGYGYNNYDYPDYGLGTKAPNRLTLAVLVCILCPWCFFLQIPAIVLSVMSHYSSENGDYWSGLQQGRCSMWLSIISLVVGFILALVGGILLLLYLLGKLG